MREKNHIFEQKNHDYDPKESPHLGLHPRVPVDVVFLLVGHGWAARTGNAQFIPTSPVPIPLILPALVSPRVGGSHLDFQTLEFVFFLIFFSCFVGVFFLAINEASRPNNSRPVFCVELHRRALTSVGFERVHNNDWFM